MDNATMTGSDLLRLVGFMGIMVGLAWALQILGFGDQSAMGRLVWVLAAASISGAGVGLVVASGTLPTAQTATARA